MTIPKLPTRTAAQLAQAAEALAALRPGQRARIQTPHGSIRTGRVVLVNADSVVLDCGGRYGTPAVATARNLVI